MGVRQFLANKPKTACTVKACICSNHASPWNLGTKWQMHLLARVDSTQGCWDPGSCALPWSTRKISLKMLSSIDFELYKETNSPLLFQPQLVCCGKSLNLGEVPSWYPIPCRDRHMHQSSGIFPVMAISFRSVALPLRQAWTLWHPLSLLQWHNGNPMVAAWAWESGNSLPTNPNSMHGGGLHLF